jgi:hypothetical protein
MGNTFQPQVLQLNMNSEANIIILQPTVVLTIKVRRLLGRCTAGTGLWGYGVVEKQRLR